MLMIAWFSIIFLGAIGLSSLLAATMIEQLPSDLYLKERKPMVVVTGLIFLSLSFIIFMSYCN